MTERDELPEGWQFLSDGQGRHRGYRVQQPGNALTTTAWVASRQIAALLAWRIVDAEKEALVADDPDLSSASDEALRQELARRDLAKMTAFEAQQRARAKYFCPACGCPDSWHARDCPTDTSE